eukprot:2888919-Amphidinium_carterae.1
MEVPFVAWQPTSPQLSDREQYPYVARTLPSASSEGPAVWAWMFQFQVPSLTFLCSSDYACELVAQATLGAATDQGFRIHRATCETESHSINSATQCLLDARAIGSRFLLLALPPAYLTLMLYVMELENVLYNGAYQTFALSSFQQQNQTFSPSRGLPP